MANSARVASVDRAARTVALSLSGKPPRAYEIGRGVQNWDDIDVGDQIQATIREVLTVYVPPASAGSSLNAGSTNRSPDARVLLVDPSYRLLTVQYLSGGTQTFKIGLHTQLEDIEPGDSIAVRPLEAIKLRVRRHSSRDGTRRSSQSATSVR